MLKALKNLVNKNAPLVARGRFFSEKFVIGVGENDWLIETQCGRIIRVDKGPFLMHSWRFSIRASIDTWEAFWQPVPLPGYHDLFAMTKSGNAIIEGDIQPMIANLRYIKEVLETLRETPSGRTHDC